MTKAPAPAGPVAMPRELYGVQSLRGVAALLVVLDHVLAFHRNFFLPGFLTVGEAGVDLFFVISGFIMMYVTPRAFRGWRDQASFLLRRFGRIYPSYWALALPLVLLWIFNPGHVYRHPEKHELLSTLLLTPSRTVPVVNVAWTLVYELYFYVVASGIFYFGWKRRLALIGLWFAVIATALLLHPAAFENPWLKVWLSPLTFEFIFGMVIAQILQGGRRRVGGRMAAIVIALAAVAAFAAGVAHGQFNVYEPDVVRVVCYGIPAAIVLGLVLQMELQGTWPWVGGLTWIGDRSYSIYLVHVPMLAAIQYLTVRWLKFSNPLEAVLIFVALFGLAILPIEAFYRWVEAPSHRLARKLAQSVRPASARGV
jgi:peptidoglycan/LPS O-acetylase OafA/YrhL